MTTLNSLPTHYQRQRAASFSFRFAARVLTVALLACLLALTGCRHDDDDDDETAAPEPTPEPASLRVIHAAADAPPVNILLNGENAVENFDYADSTGFIEVSAGEYDIAVDGIIPGGLARVIDAPAFALPEGSQTTILAGGKLADMSIAPIVVSGSDTAPASGEVGLQVVHASPDAPAVNVYVTSVDEDISMVNPNFTFDFSDIVDAGALPVATYRIRVTLPGMSSPVYDSGPVDLTPFAGSSLLIAAISTTNATQQAVSPVQLLVATDDSHLVLQHIDTKAGLRAVHASPNANTVAGGPVEVYATSDALGPDPVELIDGFSYLEVVPNISSHVPVPAGDYLIDVAPDTNTILDSVYQAGPLPLAAGAEYSVVATGRVLDEPPFAFLVSAEDIRSIASQTAVRVIHAAPAAGDVDVYVTEAGAFTADEVVAGMAGDPLLTSFSFGSVTDFVALAPGNFDIRVLAGGLVAINVENASLPAGAITSIVARGPDEPMGSPDDFGVILLSN